ncbi:MAG: PLP-dependent aminotransferase family protein [Bryobacterales bacterium]|nr:PLP-dependent aminotransferase family protein [Bryobacterales bacterium]
MLLGAVLHPVPHLDPSSGEPIYRQLYRHLKTLIDTGQLSKGARIPPTRELAGQLGLNRTTVAAAYELLENEGLIKGHVGRGSFVEASVKPAGFGWDGWLGQADISAGAPLRLQGGGAISFASSRPADELFPVLDFQETCAEVLASRDLPSILQLGGPGGYTPLRRHLQAQGARLGLMGLDDDVIVTSGCQQAMDLLQRVLVSPSDSVVVEDPVYPGLRNVFQRAGVRVLGVPVGPSGIDTEALERTVAREHPRLIVVTPNFQNPTGITMPLSARQGLLSMACAAGVPIVENDIYGDLRYESEPIASLKQLDASGAVIQVKSYSKVAFPGLRVGWVTGHRAVIARLTEAKQWTDLHTDHLSQAVLLRFAESGRLEAHLRRVQAAGAERLRAAIAGCERHLPEDTRFTRPLGGMSLWVRLPEPLDAAALLPRVERENVTYLPGRYFAVSRAEPGAFRLSFAGLTPQKISAGLAILGAVFESELEGAVAARRMEPAPAIV